MRQRESLSPEEVRELDALERALAGDPVDADLRELEELVNDIRATAPEMSPGFAASLEHRVAEGFPATDEHPAPRSPRRWVLFPAAGALCAALVGLVVVLGSTGGVPVGSDDVEPGRRQRTGREGGGDAGADVGGLVERARAARTRLGARAARAGRAARRAGRRLGSVPRPARAAAAPARRPAPRPAAARARCSAAPTSS